MKLSVRLHGKQSARKEEKETVTVRLSPYFCNVPEDTAKLSNRTILNQLFELMPINPMPEHTFNQDTQSLTIKTHDNKHPHNRP